MGNRTVFEISKCREFVNNTCGCKMADGKPCSGLFSLEQYIEFSAQSSFLTHEQLDFWLIGSVLSTVIAIDKGVGRHQAKRQRIIVVFMHRGYHLCRTTYTFLYRVTKHHNYTVQKGTYPGTRLDDLNTWKHQNTST